ncbi:MAG: hypothetical protein JF614_10880 [Acidobacteria bacterium]|nr:hypothetical protein [Acidobacteriota bacterium]
MSDLYQRAVASLLEEERESLTVLETWLPDRLPENLRSESHLLGDRPWGDPAELAKFLRCCSREHAKVETDEERRTGYQGSCTSFEGKGLPIERDRLPDRLLRYSRSDTVTRALIKKALGRQAKGSLNRELISIDEALAGLSTFSWDPRRMGEEDRLGRGKMVFATFEHPAGAPRDSAQGMAEALALPRGPLKDEFLLEFSYPTDSVTNHRFPTVAEAGWVPEFQPALEVRPDPARPDTCWGQTRPRGSSTPQPELVHGNASLRVLDRPPRFLGRFNS